MDITPQRFIGRLVMLALLLVTSGSAAAVGERPQPAGPPTVRRLVTNKTPLDLASFFGAFDTPAGNAAGDVAWSSGSSALFVRRAAAAHASRVFQMGDPIPGVADSAADIFTGGLAINDAGAVAFTVFFSQPDATNLRALIVRDANGALSVVARTGADTAFASLTLVGMNNARDIAFTAIPQGGDTSGQGQTLFLAPGGAPPVRLAGPGDAVPGAAGTLTGIAALSLSNAGEMLFRASLAGGPAGTGLFVASRSGVRKVIAPGDPAPSGMFPAITTGFLNSSGAVAFNALGAVWLHTPGSGLQAIAMGPVAAPAAVGGSLGNFNVLGLNDSGQLALSAAVTGSAATTQVLLRSTPGQPLEVVAFRNQAMPGGGRTFLAFSPVSLHADGRVSFVSTLSGSGPASGLFQQASGSTPARVAVLGDAAPVAGDGSLGSFAGLSALHDGRVLFRAAVFGGSAYDGIFLGSAAGVQKIASTDDALPAGARVSLRSAFSQGQRGDFAMFRAFLAGGRASLWRTRLSTGELQRIVGEGDTAPETAGSRVAILSSTSVVSVNTAGHVAFASSLVGGTAGIGNGVFLVDAPGSLRKVAATNDIEPATGRAFTGLTLNTGKPSALNDAGHIVFRASLAGAPAANGIFIYQSPGPSVKLVTTGDPAPGGGTFSSFSAPALNHAGHVAFTAVKQAAPGVSTNAIYVVEAGSPAQKIAAPGDAAPGGGTFASGFATTPSINDLGQVAFKGRLEDGSAGVFVGSIGAGLRAIARQGEASPAGGSFDIAALVDGQTLINNAGDVAFRADLSGAAADSGYFLRHEEDGRLTTVVRQGQPAPGTQGTFDTINRSINNILGELFDLDDAGRLVFASSVAVGKTVQFGTFEYSPDGRLAGIAVRGDYVPGTGHGFVLASAAQMIMTTGTGRHVFWVRLAGSHPVTDAIVVSK